jgi:hypothetical protein
MREEATMQAAKHPILWKLTIYRSPYSLKVDGYCYFEGPRRIDVITLMRKFLASGGQGALAHSLRDVMAGTRRYTIKREHARRAYLARDLAWRGWNKEAWEKTPPAPYDVVHIPLRTPERAYHA